MINSDEVQVFLSDFHLKLQAEYIDFLRGFKNWVRADLDLKNKMLGRSDWAFPGVKFLANRVEMLGAKTRPWFQILTSYFEVFENSGKQIQTNTGLVLSKHEALGFYAFAEDEGDILLFDRQNECKVALFLHDEGKIFYTNLFFYDILNSMKIFYSE